MVGESNGIDDVSPDDEPLRKGTWPNRAARACERVAAQLNSLARRLSGESERATDDVTLQRAKLVRAVILARRIRDRSFPDGLFGEPAWDMLLDIYLARAEARRVSVMDVCLASSVPPTTALRWLDTLGQQGLIIRLPDPHDPRLFFVELTAKGETLMDSYFGRVSLLWNRC